VGALVRAILVGAPGTLWVMGALVRAAKGTHQGCPYPVVNQLLASGANDQPWLTDD
jgi:hypothetical protein